MPTSTRTDAPRRRTRQRQPPRLSFRTGDRRHRCGNPHPQRQGVMHDMARGERIAAPVCGLVRNDIIVGLSHSPNPFICGNACLRVDVASHIPARSAACVFLSHAAGIDPYEMFAALRRNGGVRSPRPTSTDATLCDKRGRGRTPPLRMFTAPTNHRPRQNLPTTKERVAPLFYWYRGAYRPDAA